MGQELASLSRRWHMGQELASHGLCLQFHIQDVVWAKACAHELPEEAVVCSRVGRQTYLPCMHYARASNTRSPIPR
eukprot:366522-Chlamydomonas_euryale.AAC.32